MRESALHLIEQHGYLGLYISLALGILGIPIPDETLMTYTGYLVFRGQLSWLPAVMVSTLGSLTGMSMSYWIGRLVGIPFIHRFGKYVHITPERFDKGEELFHKYGARSIIFGYFVPGFRHLTAYVSGISKMGFGSFLGVAAVGAVSWVVVFISAGSLIGKDWALIGGLTHRYMGLLFVVAVLLILVVTGVRKEKLNSK